MAFQVNFTPKYTRELLIFTTTFFAQKVILLKMFPQMRIITEINMY